MFGLQGYVATIASKKKLVHINGSANNSNDLVYGYGCNSLASCYISNVLQLFFRSLVCSECRSQIVCRKKTTLNKLNHVFKIFTQIIIPDTVG